MAGRGSCSCGRGCSTRSDKKPTAATLSEVEQPASSKVRENHWFSRTFDEGRPSPGPDRTGIPEKTRVAVPVDGAELSGDTKTDPLVPELTSTSITHW